MRFFRFVSWANQIIGFHKVWLIKTMFSMLDEEELSLLKLSLFIVAVIVV